MQVLLRYRRCGFAPARDLARHLAADRGYLALKVPEARLSRVLADHLSCGCVGDRDKLRGKAVLVNLSRHNVLFGYLELLLLCVARQVDYLHAVAQRRGYRVSRICGHYEHDAGEIVRDVQVVVGEGVVLFRVEHLQECARRVSAKVHAYLVYLVHHEDRVCCSGLLYALDNPSWQRTDVGSAMAAYFGLVLDAAERDTDELSAHAPGNRFA